MSCCCCCFVVSKPVDSGDYNCVAIEAAEAAAEAIEVYNFIIANS